MATNPIVLDTAAFRLAYRQFANATAFPDATLQMYFTSATNIISATWSSCDYLADNARQNALYLLTAHLADLFLKINAGEVPTFMKSATIDKVSVSIEPPPNATQFQWWLSLTGYGQQLLAILMVKAVGGFMGGGLPERAAFSGEGGRPLPGAQGDSQTGAEVTNACGLPYATLRASWARSGGSQARTTRTERPLHTWRLFTNMATRRAAYRPAWA